MKIAEYRCLCCGHEYRQEVDPPRGKLAATQCPRCGHLYVLWLNFERDFKRP